MSKNKKKALFYARTSTKSQDISRQDKNIDEYIKKHDLIIVKKIEEQESGSNEDYNIRHGFFEMFDYLKKNKDVKIVVFDEISRLGRNATESAISYREFNKLKIEEIHSIKQGIFNPNDSQDKLYFHILSSLSEYEIEMMKHRMLSGKRGVLIDNRKYENNYNTIFGQPPYGYNLNKVIHDEGEKITRQTLEINPKEAENIKKMFELVGNEKRSVNYVRGYLKKEKILTPLNKNEIWAASTIKKILRNTLYYGKGIYNIQGEPIDFKVPKIIDKELFDKVDKQLTENNNTNINPKHYKLFLFKNIIYINLDDGNKKMLQTNIEKDKVNEGEVLKQYRNPERNLKNQASEGDFISKRKSLISVLDSKYIEKVTFSYLLFLISQSNFFDKDNINKLNKLLSENEIKKLEDELINLKRQVNNIDNINLDLNKKNGELNNDLINITNDDIKITIERKIKLNDNTINSNIKDQIYKEKKIGEIEEKLLLLQNEKSKLEKLKDLKKGLSFIKKKEIEELINEKNLEDTKTKLLKYISCIEIQDEKELTQNFRNFVKTLKIKNFYNEENKLLREIYFSVYNRNKELTFIKNSSYIVSIKIKFQNGIYSPPLYFVYNHKNPDLYFPLHFEELIKKYGGDEKSQKSYREVFYKFQSFDINY